jgi:hypothetical protein
MFKATTLFFQPGSLVADHRDPADRLMLVSLGSLDLFVYPNETNSPRLEARLVGESGSWEEETKGGGCCPKTPICFLWGGGSRGMFPSLTGGIDGQTI